MNRKVEYIQQCEDQLDAWSDEINRLKQRAHEAGGNSRIERLQTIDQLRAQREIARHKLINLQKADDEAWPELKSGVDIAWKQLGSAIRSAVDR